MTDMSTLAGYAKDEIDLMNKSNRGYYRQQEVDERVEELTDFSSGLINDYYREMKDFD